MHELDDYNHHYPEHDYASVAPYHYTHESDGQHDHFFYEPTFDFESVGRHPLSTNTGVNANDGLFKLFEGTFRTEQIFND